MKYLFYILFLSCSIVYSQTAKIEYKSIVNFSNSKLVERNFNLYINNRASLFTKQKENKVKKSTNLTNHKNNPNTEEIYIGIQDDPKGNQYYYDLKNNDFTVREPLFENFNMKFYIYEDKGAGKIKWQLQDEFKTISGYKCQKATCIFRGRNYEAWFTPKIPLPYGPWKLVGLPGLILEVYNLKKEIQYTVEHIQTPLKGVDNFLIKPNDSPRISHRKFVNKNKQVATNIIKAMKARMPKGNKIKSIETKRNDIELEFEWEKE